MCARTYHTLAADWSAANANAEIEEEKTAKTNKGKWMAFYSNWL